EVTKADCELRSFDFQVKWFVLPLRLVLGVFRPRKNILGGYFAGVIEAVGSDVTKFKVGDAIFGSGGMGFGAHAEYLTVAEGNTLALMPDNVSFEQAAAVPLGGLNALHFMRMANIQAGETVLINGAGGSIGMFALMIAKDMGAVVSVVDASYKEAMLRDIGVEQFFDYTSENFTASGQKYDVIFDMVPGSSFSGCIKMLNPNGRYIIGNPRLSDMIRCVITTKTTDKTARFAFAKETVEELEALAMMLTEGRINPVIYKIFSMEGASEAHHLVETEQRLGAIVLTMP
ncbi:MAG: NAD(P)-dependent alcohol dehydrogenase, partial [Alphaproteobacteria bacterium]